MTKETRSACCYSNAYVMGCSIKSIRCGRYYIYRLASISGFRLGEAKGAWEEAIIYLCASPN